jgi:putative oxidoreductase
MRNGEVNKVSIVVFRIMLSLIFIVAAVNHLFEGQKVANRLAKSEMSSLVTWMATPYFLVTAAGVALLIGGIGLLSGFKTRLSAILLILVLIPITLTIQVSNPEGLGPLFKNIGLLGGLIFFATNGALHYSIDNITNKNTQRS